MDQKEVENYIQKRELILFTLEPLFDHWDMARPICELVQSKEVTKETIDDLIDLIKETIKEIKEEEVISNLQNALSKFEQYAIQENAEAEKEHKELEDSFII